MGSGERRWLPWGLANKQKPEHLKINRIVEKDLPEPKVSPPSQDAVSHGNYQGKSQGNSLNNFSENDRPEPRTLPPSQGVVSQSNPQGNSLNNSSENGSFASIYRNNMDRLNKCIYASGKTISALDTIELRLMEAKNYINRLNDTNQYINHEKANEIIMLFAQQVNDLVSKLDHDGMNMLRDSRVQIRFVELDSYMPVNGVDLTLISLEKLLSFKLNKQSCHPDEWLEFINKMSKIVSNNVQIISSIMLALIASRDYTNEVTNFAIAENIVRPEAAPIPHHSKPHQIGNYREPAPEHNSTPVPHHNGSAQQPNQQFDPNLQELMRAVRMRNGTS